MAKNKYDPDTFPTLVEGYAREGMIEKEIASKLNISVATFETYKTKYPEFLEALKRGKAPVDIEVEKALLRRALGYDFKEHKTINSDKEGFKEEDIYKHQPGDTTAMIFWLKNRKPDKWRDKQDIEMSGSVGVQIIDDIEEGENR